MTKQLHSVCRTYSFFQRWALHQPDKPRQSPNNVRDNLTSTKEGFLNSLNNVQHIIETFIKVLGLVCSFWQVAITWGIFIKKHFFERQWQKRATARMTVWLKRKFLLIHPKGHQNQWEWNFSWSPHSLFHDSPEDCCSLIKVFLILLSLCGVLNP